MDLRNCKQVCDKYYVEKTAIITLETRPKKDHLTRRALSKSLKLFMEKKKYNSRDFSSRQRSGYKRLSRFER